MTPPDDLHDDIDAHARSIWPQRDADWLDQLDWTDAAFAYGLMAVVAVGCFTLGMMAGAYFF